MAKKDIHPEMHDLNVVLADGTKFVVQSTHGKEGDTMRLDVDPTNHPAWRTDQNTFLNANNDRVSKFNKKYGDAFGAK